MSFPDFENFTGLSPDLNEPDTEPVANRSFEGFSGENFFSQPKEDNPDHALNTDVNQDDHYGSFFDSLPDGENCEVDGNFGSAQDGLVTPMNSAIRTHDPRLPKTPYFTGTSNMDSNAMKGDHRASKNERENSSGERLPPSSTQQRELSAVPSISSRRAPNHEQFVTPSAPSSNYPRQGTSRPAPPSTPAELKFSSRNHEADSNVFGQRSAQPVPETNREQFSRNKRNDSPIRPVAKVPDYRLQERSVPFQPARPASAMNVKANPFELMQKVESERTHMKQLIEEKQQEVNSLRSSYQMAQKQVSGISVEIEKAKSIIKGKDQEIESFNQKFEVIKDRFVTLSERFKKLEAGKEVLAKLRKTYSAENQLKDQLLRQFNVEHEAKMKKVRGFIEELNGCLNKTGKDAADLSQKLLAKKAEYQKLDIAHREALDKHSQYKAISEQENARIVGEWNKTKQEVADLQAQLTENEEKSNELRVKLEMCETALSKLQSQKEEEEKVYKDEMEKSAQVLEAKTNEILVLEVGNSQLKQDIEKLEADLLKKVEECAELEKGIATLQEDSAKAQQVLEQEKQELVEKMNEKSQEMVVIKNQIQELENKVTEGEEKFKEMDNKLQLKDELIEVIKSELSEKNQELAIVKEQNQKLDADYHNKMNDTTLNIDELNSRNETLVETVENFRQQLEEGEARAKEDHEKYSEQLGQMLHDIEKKNHEVRIIKEKSLEKLAGKETEIRRLNKEMEGLERKVTDYKRLLEEKESEIPELEHQFEEKMRDQKSKQSQLENQLQNCKRQNESLLLRVDDLQKELDNLRKKSDLENDPITSTPVAHGSPHRSSTRKRLGFAFDEETDIDDQEEETVRELKKIKAAPKSKKTSKAPKDNAELYRQTMIASRGDSATFRTVKKGSSSSENNRTRALKQMKATPASDGSESPENEWF